MIEIERKIKLSEQDEARLTEGAELMSEKTFADVYYDGPDFALTTQDKWLRSRAGRWELKVAVHESLERQADQYDEIEDEAGIRASLGLPPGDDLAADIAQAGYAPFASPITTRKKYRSGQFTIDLDTVDFGDSTYTLGEIEVMAEDQSQADDAARSIIEFAKERGVEIKPTRGKIIEYLKRFRLEHYQALVEAGIVKDF
ncbi:TPA: hypothetical protein DHW58_02415 [Patescibacteria group bacterium]|uniref:CYTH domain-containing protein n=2 Tax=Bacteria division Kazan-3B-28 TaxID=1798534 RepID=A0A0G1X7P1_UNCK3|nr:MAG: thtpa, thiamine triphosphatase, thiamine-triphosphatase [candidate division Kazan bacterium GW2011_GWA1_50_15]KKW25544.1 MAG: hypothetical protein VE99_C0001G0181 [candidate division Kazan bacterium GW2011_GWC1_52_13]KKW26850.1 MAG: hypothetical protein VF00_C0002G0175 [candidate division Kazan bacterium GW2011_GWB1_52_7]HAV65843.1 hypothetical protein [Patescibacteria group bacterium]HCL47823.1 hypothetical protein [Patescibacteria group bacterium]